mmetsp:Transcript_61557/g.133232  ORF Transcript_61557/g.133232 Transcript_61557/m.133232 type:complete len:104 (-) Transcript_61557:30-341(-)
MKPRPAVAVQARSVGSTAKNFMARVVSLTIPGGKCCSTADQLRLSSIENIFLDPLQWQLSAKKVQRYLELLSVWPSTESVWEETDCLGLRKIFCGAAYNPFCQ